MAWTVRKIIGCGAWGVLCCALLTGVAYAQGVPALVVLVASDPASQAARRLSKELQGIGIDVLVLKATPENSSGRESLERSARSVGAIAAVRLVASGGGTEVWVADRITGKTVIRELMGPTGADAEPDDVAVGAVELLRASLMELHSPNPPRGEAEAPQVVRDCGDQAERGSTCPQSSPRATFVRCGPAMDLGLGRFGASLHSNVAAWGWITKGAGVHAFAWSLWRLRASRSPKGAPRSLPRSWDSGSPSIFGPPRSSGFQSWGPASSRPTWSRWARGTYREPTRRSRAGTAGDTVNWASRCAWPRRYAYASTPLRWRSVSPCGVGQRARGRALGSPGRVDVAGGRAVLGAVIGAPGTRFLADFQRPGTGTGTFTGAVDGMGRV